MSQNIQLGIAAICGGATYGLTSLATFPSTVGIAFALTVGGLVLILLATKEKDTHSVEETSNVSKKSKKEKKSAPSPQKTAPKTPKTPKVEPKEEPVEPETPEKSKKKKKGKKTGGTPISSPVSSPQPVKSKGTPKVEEDKEDKEKSKAQLRKAKKKEAEQKHKAEEEKQRAAELAKKAAEQKREAAQQKKAQAKARKAAQKATQEPTKAETKVELKHSHEPEPGWDVATNRKNRAKDGKESKEPIVADIKVPPRAHAKIIGKQGDQLRQITEGLDVIITMPKRESGNDIILIKGLPRAVHLAKKAIEEIAVKGYSSVTHPGWITKQYPLQNKYQLSLVFGEKGATLEKIASASGTRLQMPEKGTDNLQLSVTGDERSIEHAFTLIQELVDQGYTKDTHPDWVAEEVHVGESAMGAIIGTKGARLKDFTKQFKVKIDLPRRETAAKNDVLTVKGPKKQVALFKQEIANILASREAPIEQEVPDPAWQEDVQEVAW
eukprot:TRINITY_DN4154_c0_g1_i3.p1 TRINITY_DN4154_c0_g1~~TRINITY_DN4154_c0_g1_i3.p1  ORF type:complete len:495 (+),score=97.91 TRINITY_DN4154_c0_g1_i3:49-1533(+)